MPPNKQSGAVAVFWAVAANFRVAADSGHLGVTVTSVSTE
jgi:hypothetical protein